MASDQIHEMSRAIGSLESSVKTLTDLHHAQVQETQSSRRVIQETMSLLRDEAQRVEAVVENLVREFAEIKPAIIQFKKSRERAEAQKSLIALWWAGVITFATGIGYAASIILEYVKAWRSH